MAEATGEEKATCRGCGMILRGKPYYMGGCAYHPTKGYRCPANHYGGYVCSETCDRRAALHLEQSMPQHHGQVRLDYNMSRAITEKWEEIERNR